MLNGNVQSQGFLNILLSLIVGPSLLCQHDIENNV